MAILAGQFLRQTSLHVVESIVRTARLRKMGVERRFGDDTLGYSSERADPAPTRQALIDVLHRAKRNKTFQNSVLLGLAVCRQTSSLNHSKSALRPPAVRRGLAMMGP